jgi:phage protein D
MTMPLTIEQVEYDRQNFYAPAFNILTAGQSLVEDLHLEVASVHVDLTLGMPGRFTFVINNAFIVADREFVEVNGRTLPEFFEFGSRVAISMGYGDRKKLDLVLTGVITELSTTFPSAGIPQITVSGYDHSYCLGKGADSQTWEGKRDSDAVRDMASLYHLNPRVDDTLVPHLKIERSQESALRFLNRLARRNGFEWFVEYDDLVFRKPANDKAGAIELAWGKGLVSFSPEIQLTEQVTEVEVYGWNIQTKKPIVGRARKGDEPGRDQKNRCGRPRASGAEYLQRFCKQDLGTLRVREPVFSQQEADRRARAILKRRAEGFVGGRGESIGIPDIRPNTNVTLTGLGCFFETTFYVQQVTHTVDTGGYRTTFEVKDTTI